MDNQESSISKTRKLIMSVFANPFSGMNSFMAPPALGGLTRGGITVHDPVASAQENRNQIFNMVSGFGGATSPFGSGKIDSSVSGLNFNKISGELNKARELREQLFGQGSLGRVDEMLRQGDLSKIKPYDKGMIVAVTLWQREQRKLIPPGCQIVGEHLECQVPIKK